MDTLLDTRLPEADSARGNLLKVREVDSQLRVQKIYRSRRGRFRETLAAISHRFFEGKRGVRPAQRWETERTALTLWRREGFDVPRLVAAPSCADAVDGPCLWLEYLEGPRLFELLHDATVPGARKAELVRELASAQQQRHRRALELNEPLLLHEHPTTKHVLLVDERLVTIDLEGGYRPGYPVLFGVAQELAGFVRSVWTGAAPCFEEPLPLAYLEGYADPSLLADACRAWTTLGPWRWFRRSDQRRRGTRSKYSLMDQLSRYLGAQNQS